MGGGAPTAPDYTPIINSATTNATRASRTALQQLQWAKNQSAGIMPQADQYLRNMIDQQQKESGWADEDRARYESLYAPLQLDYATKAQGWDTPERENQQAGAAMADVSNTFNAARTASLQQLEGYGVDPSATRFGALDLGTRIQQAAATAQAGTQARVNTALQGMQLEGNAIGQGQGVQQGALGEATGATTSGAAGVGSAGGALGAVTNAMGAPTDWAKVGTGALGTASGAMGSQYNDQMKSYEAEQNQGSSLGGAVGGLLGGALALGTGGGSTVGGMLMSKILS